MRLSGHDLVCLSGAEWDPRAASNRAPLMARLAEMNRVLFVEPARAPWALGEGRGLRRLAHNLQLAPPQLATGLPWWDELRLVARVRRACSRLGWRAPILWLDPLAPGAEALRKAPGWSLVIAHMPHAGTELPASGLRQLAAADLAFWIHREQQRRHATAVPRGQVLADGIDFARLNRAVWPETPELPALAGLPTPRVGYLGPLDASFDWDLWYYLAAYRPDWTFVAAGSCSEELAGHVRREARPNMRFLGPPDPEEWPSFLKACQVMAHPVRHGATARGLGVYEAFAAGKPVVSREALELDELVTRALTPHAFLEALDAAVRPSAAATARRIQCAQAHTWEAAAQSIEGAVLDALARRAQPSAIPLLVERVVRQAL